MNKEQIEKAAYDISDSYANEKDLEYLITELQFWLKERKRQLKEIQDNFIDNQYKKMKQYIYNASDEELKRHYEWYQVLEGDKEDLLNTMFESYCNTYDDEELEKEINKLLEEK